MIIIKKTVLFYIILIILCCKTCFIRIFAMSNRKTLSINLKKRSFMKKMKFVAAKVKKIIKEGLNENGKNYMMYPYNF